MPNPVRPYSFFTKFHNALVCEISDLGPRFQLHEGISVRLPAAIDQETVHFVVDRAERDRDGDLRKWILEPLRADRRRAAGLVVHILND